MADDPIKRAIMEYLNGNPVRTLVKTGMPMEMEKPFKTPVGTLLESLGMPRERMIEVLSNPYAGVLKAQESGQFYSPKPRGEVEWQNRIQGSLGRFFAQAIPYEVSPMEMTLGTISQIKNPERVSKVFSTKAPIPIIEDILNNPTYQLRNKGRTVRLEWMSPVEYLKLQAEVKGVPLEKDIMTAQHSLVAEYSNAMKKLEAGESNRQFPALWVEPAKKNQEGKHRAIAALHAGIDELPVYIIEYPEGIVK